MKKLSILLFAASGLLIMHTAFAALDYDRGQTYPDIHAFFDSLAQATTVSDLAVTRMSVRVEISEAELSEINLLTGIAAIQQAKGATPRRNPDTIGSIYPGPLIGSLSK